MLGAMRRRSRSFMVWLLFGFLIAVFVIGFGTPASNKMACGNTTAVGKVGDHEIHKDDYQFAFRLIMREGVPATAKAYMLDMLIRREILAEEAVRMGFQPAVQTEDAAEDPDVVKLITSRKVVVLGFERDLFNMGGWPAIKTKKGYKPAEKFNYDHFKKWTNWRLGLNVNQFMKQEQRELLAKQAGDAIMSGVLISDGEVRARYEEDHTRLSARVATFEAGDYLDKVWVDKAKLDEFLSNPDNVKKVDEEYQSRYADKKDFPDERRVRHILFKVAADAKEADWNAKKAELARIARKLTVENFGSLAQVFSQDDETKLSGGLLGWIKADDDRFGPEFSKALLAAKVGVISGPVKGKDGWHLFVVEARRKGTWPKEAARRFIAYEMLARKKALELARKLANRAMERLRKGEDADKVFGGPMALEEHTGVATPGLDVAAEQAPAAYPMPELKDVNVRRTDKTVEGLEEVTGLAGRLWAMGKAGLFDKVLEIKRAGKTSGFGIVDVVKVIKPNWREFEKQKDAMKARYLQIKQTDTLNRWVRARCEKMVAAGKIHFDKSLTIIRYYPKGAGEDAKPVVVKYRYCKQLPAHAPMAGGGF